MAGEYFQKLPVEEKRIMRMKRKNRTRSPEAINNSIQEILKTTVNNDSLFSTFIELVFKSEKDLKIFPEMIVNCVHLNTMLITGILFLEWQIIKFTSDEEESQAKRIKR
jgi:hypothetical protein